MRCLARGRSGLTSEVGPEDGVELCEVVHIGELLAYDPDRDRWNPVAVGDARIGSVLGAFARALDGQDPDCAHQVRLSPNGRTVTVVSKVPSPKAERAIELVGDMLCRACSDAGLGVSGVEPPELPSADLVWEVREVREVRA